jgi:acid phosphatase type 7
MVSPVRWLLAVLMLAPSTPSPIAAELTRGPFLQNVTTHSAVVACEGPGLAAVTLHFAQEDAPLTEMSCDCVAPHCGCNLSSLAPDSGYAYEVRSGDELLGAGKFRTAPDGPATFHFAVHGDNRSDHISHALVVENLMGEDFAFIMNTGDLVSSGEIEADWDEFFKVEDPLLANVPIYPAVGNHEEDNGEIPIYERLFHLPAVESGSGDEAYYSFDYVNAHFVVLDNSVNIHPWYECLLLGKLYDNCFNSDQLAWIQLDLAKAVADSSIDHVFVFVHEGPYSSKEGRTGSAAMRELLPLFAKSKVKVVFSGHDHYFEHGLTGNGLNYVISGGGGAPLYDLKTDFLNQLAPHEVLINKEIHNYQIVTVEGPHVKVVTRDVDELSLLEEFEIGELPACVLADDCSDQDEGSCEGFWECADFKCVWVCNPAPSCEIPEDCPADPVGRCDGVWECSPDGFCEWLCDPDPECLYGADCQGKAPLNDCKDGVWQCEDEVCEWFCPPPVEPINDVDDGPEIVAVTDISEPGDTAGGVELTVETDAAVVEKDSKDSNNEPLHPSDNGDRSNGCTAAHSPASGSLVLLLLLMTTLVWHRRREQQA